jgi:hypothetical protein
MEPLHYAALSESTLQHHFDTWAAGAPVRAGAPPWIETLRGWTRQLACTDAWEFGFRPDMLAHDGAETFVFELKYARKGEPLALAEVLHHAHALATRPASLGALGSGWPQRGAIRPVIVSQFNAWLRDSRRYLISHGFRADRLLVLEVAGLRDRAGNVWLLFNELDGEDPWTALSFDELPPDVGRVLEPDPAARYFARARTGAYAALSGGTQSPDAYEAGVFQRRIARTGDHARWIVWHGTGAENGSYFLASGR